MNIVEITLIDDTELTIKTDKCEDLVTLEFKDTAARSEYVNNYAKVVKTTGNVLRLSKRLSNFTPRAEFR